MAAALFLSPIFLQTGKKNPLTLRSEDFLKLNYTSWMIAISAASPRRWPILTIRV